MSPCPRCDGTGEVSTSMGVLDCSFCKGDASVTQKQSEMYIEGARLRQLRVDAGYASLVSFQDRAWRGRVVGKQKSMIVRRRRIRERLARAERLDAGMADFDRGLREGAAAVRRIVTAACAHCGSTNIWKHMHYGQLSYGCECGRWGPWPAGGQL